MRAKWGLIARSLLLSQAATSIPEASDRVFSIPSGVTVTIRDLTIQRGRAHRASDEGARGGGVYNAGTLTLLNSALNNNRARRNRGGGLYNHGQASLMNSRVFYNIAWSDGGGIYNNGELTVADSTISHNTAQYGGGGLANSDRLTVATSIIAGNAVSGGGSDHDCWDGSLLLTTKGYNLVGISTGCPRDRCLGDRAVDPAKVFTHVLGPLRDNGGPTFTHALRPGSRAFNAIPEGTNGCGPTITTDQRGIERPQGAGCDIGAFELEEP